MDVPYYSILNNMVRSYLKNRIQVQDQGGFTFQPAGIMKYVEELKRESNTDIGAEDIFEMAYSYSLRVKDGGRPYFCIRRATVG